MQGGRLKPTADPCDSDQGYNTLAKCHCEEAVLHPDNLRVVIGDTGYNIRTGGAPYAKAVTTSFIETAPNKVRTQRRGTFPQRYDRRPLEEWLEEYGKRRMQHQEAYAREQKRPKTATDDATVLPHDATVGTRFDSPSVGLGENDTTSLASDDDVGFGAWNDEALTAAPTDDGASQPQCDALSSPTKLVAATTQDGRDEANEKLRDEANEKLRDEDAVMADVKKQKESASTLAKAILAPKDRLGRCMLLSEDGTRFTFRLGQVGEKLSIDLKKTWNALKLPEGQGRVRFVLEREWHNDAEHLFECVAQVAKPHARKKKPKRWIMNAKQTCENDGCINETSGGKQAFCCFCSSQDCNRLSKWSEFQLSEPVCTIDTHRQKQDWLADGILCIIVH